MNTDYTAKITETFYSVNEFCKQIEPQFKKKVIVESTDKCKIKQSFCSTLLLMFQTFVFAWCNVFLLYACHLLVHPTLAAPLQLPEGLSQKCTCLPPQPPTRTRSARVRCFSFFAFTSSPYDCKKL